MSTCSCIRCAAPVDGSQPQCGGCGASMGAPAWQPPVAPPAAAASSPAQSDLLQRRCAMAHHRRRMHHLVELGLLLAVVYLLVRE
jgi:hypothetical protein